MLADGGVRGRKVSVLGAVLRREVSEHREDLAQLAAGFGRG